MADNNNLDINTPSRISTTSEEYRKCSLAKNSPSLSKDEWGGYICGKEYCEGSNWTISNDGDGKGRDPDDGNQQNPNIGTKKDVGMRTCLLAKNTPSKSDDGWTGYNCGNQYCAGSDLV